MMNFLYDIAFWSALKQHKDFEQWDDAHFGNRERISGQAEERFVKNYLTRRRRKVQDLIIN